MAKAFCNISLMLVVVFLFLIPAPNAQATVVPSLDSALCVQIGGTWIAGSSTCDISTTPPADGPGPNNLAVTLVFTIPPGTTLLIEPSGYLCMCNGFDGLTNYGTITNSGLLEVLGNFFNYGTVNNQNELNLRHANPTVSNFSIINNSGSIAMSESSLGTQRNNGTLNNYRSGSFILPAVSGGTVNFLNGGNVNNYGSMENRGLIQNNRLIAVFCGGSLTGSGTIAGKKIVREAPCP